VEPMSTTNVMLLMLSTIVKNGPVFIFDLTPPTHDVECDRFLIVESFEPDCKN